MTHDDLSPESKPAFLDKERAESIGYVGADSVPTFDEELIAEEPDAPTLGVRDRYREIARRHAYGETNNQIAAALGYTASRVSILLRDPFVQAEITRHRQTFFNTDALTVMKEAALDGAKRMHAIIRNPKTEDRVVLQAAQFAIEKSHGKAKQEVSVESGTLMTYMEMLRNSLAPGAADAREVLELTEAAAPREDDPFDLWLDQNLAKP